MTRTVGLFLLFLSLITLVACTSQEQLAKEQLNEDIRQTERDVFQLGVHIDKGHIANTRKLVDYGKVVKSLMVDQPPELAALVDTLTLDATRKGPIYTGLKARLVDAKVNYQTDKSLTAIQSNIDELHAIREASKIDNYGWMLTDPINVLADMSDGKLARVESMSKEASLKANNAKDFGTGSQLVGNPSYGQWNQNSSGNSFWHWYGQYAFFSSIFRQPIGYGNWSRQRDYSYYSEAGRHQYTSPAQKKASMGTEQKARQKFKQSGQSFASPYAKTKTGSARSTMKSQKVTKSFSSSYAKSGNSSRSFGSAGSRNSSSSKSRSFSGGGK
ncbi:MAG: hypothetical protein OCC45_10810 [Desulfotalea sp.]